ncbi:DUF3748 domain-containing protein [Telluribacter sp. SYSU D00476]|uniref:DUF3748 domain-containing protein n=1 Tax=Telluribacter sp. SYSU D00476 TaxID=2811430 RepID=UPI001FF48360|nr:DUF3748 domain-containing protein [Telluribacter sp. SYSU D00476]
MLLAQPTSLPQEIQLTHDLRYHHDLDNNDNFSPDDQWLVYDTRTDGGGIAESSTIEKVHVGTGEKKVLYHIPHNKSWGPGAGAVSYHPTRNAVVFIHGLQNATEQYPYQQWRRTGAMIDEEHGPSPIFIDARDVVPPFTPGALRGGTHRHEWSGDGQWIGFTYNDAIMKAIKDQTGKKVNLRTIGVSRKLRPVQVEFDQAGENVPGIWYSVLVVRVVPEPEPGSDEISYAAWDSWVGTRGYAKADGTWQVARAFIGTVRDKKGQPVDEVFVVDIPDQIDQPGEWGPLEGATTHFPMPPKGTVQRRLTYTAGTAHPGTAGIVRSSPDGSQLAYLARDSRGIRQVFLISPVGGTPVQLTEHESDVEGSVRWYPGGQSLSYVWDGSLMLCKVGKGTFGERSRRLTHPTTPSPLNPVWSHDGKTLAYNRYVPEPKSGVPTKQIYYIRPDL